MPPVFANIQYIEPPIEYKPANGIIIQSVKVSLASGHQIQNTFTFDKYYLNIFPQKPTYAEVNGIFMPTLCSLLASNSMGSDNLLYLWDRCAISVGCAPVYVSVGQQTFIGYLAGLDLSTDNKSVFGFFRAAIALVP